MVEAMRESVAEVGISGSTFDRVSAKAGVSRGPLHYYFGSKERLLVEVIARHRVPDRRARGRAARGGGRRRADRGALRDLPAHAGGAVQQLSDPTLDVEAASRASDEVARFLLAPA